jgi:multidrug efflux pump subunit AcrA (membrane-fusion protein)
MSKPRASISITRASPHPSPAASDARPSREGALVTADQTTALATIQTLDPIYVDITQSSTELLNLKLAMEGGHLTRNGPADARVTLQLDNGTQYAEAGTCNSAK